MRRIIYPVDDDLYHIATLHWATELARLTGYALTLVNEPIDTHTFVPDWDIVILHHSSATTDQLSVLKAKGVSFIMLPNWRKTRTKPTILFRYTKNTKQPMSPRTLLRTSGRIRRKQCCLICWRKFPKKNSRCCCICMRERVIHYN